MPEEVVIHPYACIDEPSKKDYLIEDFEGLLDEEQAKGISNEFPEDEFIVWNQGSTPGCTRYGLRHIINAYNILEWRKHGEVYTQIDPLEPWNRYCAERGIRNTGSSLQSALDQGKKEKYIYGYVRVDTLDKAKLAIDNGYLIYTGSSNGDRGTTGRTKTYTLRTDGQFVGHAWNIIDRDPTKGFKCTNSRGDTWGDDGFFWLPYENFNDIYSKYIIIDQEDNEYFDKQKTALKARELLMTLKDFYHISPAETQVAIATLGQRLRIDYPILQSIK